MNTRLGSEKEQTGEAPKNRDYEVGYGKPPDATRFQKGQSGNPTGRRRGSKNLSTILEEELEQRVVIRENGKQKTIHEATRIHEAARQQGRFGRPSRAADPDQLPAQPFLRKKCVEPLWQCATRFRRSAFGWRWHPCSPASLPLFVQFAALRQY